MPGNLLINDYRSKPRNFLVFISLCVLLFCILLRMFLTKRSASSTSSNTQTVKETTIITEKIIEPPKIQELKPILNTVENIDIARTMTSSAGEDNVNWGLVLFGLFCLLLLGLCFYLLYLLYKSKHKSVTPEVSDGDPIVVLIKDPVPDKPAAPVASPAPAPAANTEKPQKYERANIRVMDAPVERKYGDLTIKYEPDPLTLEYPDETIYDIRNAPEQTYTPDQQYAYQQPQQQYYVEDRPLPFDYVSQEEPKRRNIAFYDTYSAYEQRACAIPPIDYDAIGCSNTRHGERCQCETCV